MHFSNHKVSVLQNQIKHKVCKLVALVFCSPVCVSLGGVVTRGYRPLVEEDTRVVNFCLLTLVKLDTDNQAGLDNNT